MRILNLAICGSIAAGLFQGLVIAHELVHKAIFKYAGIPSKLEIGLFWGQVVPEYVAPDFTLRTGLMVANGINEALLPVEILLILIVVILLYNSMKGKDKKRGGKFYYE